MRSATARAHANIALVKYWGKRDPALNLPAASSLSMTLSGLTTTTTVCFDDDPSDRLTINGVAQEARAVSKAAPVLNAVRQQAGISTGAQVTSQNDFPTGAGLASSASAMAALVTAATAAAGLSSTDKERSKWARLGSGSAARSIFGGTVVWDAGGADDGSDCIARMVYPPSHWNLRVLVAVVNAQPKSIGSTEGMNHTRDTSPFYQAYLDTVPQDIQDALTAVAARDILGLARVAERSCLRMHATMMGAQPPVQYLQSTSYRIMDAVRQLRDEGAPLFFTVDAGPNVKIFCEPDAVDTMRSALETMDGVSAILESGIGPGAQLVEGP